MSIFSSNFSFEAPSSRPDNLYAFDAAVDNVSPTSSRCGSPSSPASSSPSCSSNSSTDDLYGLTTHLSSSSLYTPGRNIPVARRSPPRSTPSTLPPTAAQQPGQYATDLHARRERRQAYVADQLSSHSRRKLSLLVARMLGDEIHGGSRRHPNDGLHPSNVRVIPAMPAPGRNRRNTLIEMNRSSDEEGDSSMGSSDDSNGENVCESIELDLPLRTRENSNRISKRSVGRSTGRKMSSRPKK